MKTFTILPDVDQVKFRISNAEGKKSTTEEKLKILVDILTTPRILDCSTEKKNLINNKKKCIFVVVCENPQSILGRIDTDHGLATKFPESLEENNVFCEFFPHEEDELSQNLLTMITTCKFFTLEPENPLKEAVFLPVLQPSSKKALISK